MTAWVVLRAVPLAFAWLALALQIVLGAVWAVGGVGDPVVYEAKGDAVRAFSGTTTFFVALFAAIVLSQARARPRWTAVRLVAAVGVLVAVGLVGDRLADGGDARPRRRAAGRDLSALPLIARAVGTAWRAP